MDGPVIITPLKLAALAVAGARGYKYVQGECLVFRPHVAALVSRRKFAMMALYFAALLALVTAMVSAPFIRHPGLRLLLVSYFSLSAIAAVLHRNITGLYVHERAYFDESTAEVMMREANMAYDALVTYKRDVIAAAVPGVAFMAIFVLPPAPGWRVTDGWAVATVIMVVLIAAGAIRGWPIRHARGWFLPFPSLLMAPLEGAIALSRREIASPVPLAPVTLTHDTRLFDKVLFIMDESVRGDYTTLGNPVIDTTPFLAALGDRLANFGVALSGHNCSSYSRYLLRYGARPGDLPGALAHGLNLPGPTIWQFARAAGLKTVYIDGFSNSLRLHSGMSLEEAGLIDHYVRIPVARPCDRDARVADHVRAALLDPAPAFVYVDKHGAHAPYGDKYPADQIPFPALPVASPAEQLVASYKNALRWNVDHFFKRLIEDQDLSRVAMFYTSDHGQSLLEGGYSLSHCSVGPDIVPGEALVPLFALVGNGELRANLDEAADRMRDRATHFDIFATLLMALGYRRHEVEAAYGAGLLGEPASRRAFLSGFKTSTTWVDVTHAAASERLSV